MIGFDARSEDEQSFIDGFRISAQQWKKKQHHPVDPNQPTAGELDAECTKRWVAQWNVLREYSGADLPFIRDANERLGLA